MNHLFRKQVNIIQVLLEPSGEELTIKLNPLETNLLHSIVEFFTRQEENKLTSEELTFATKLGVELEYFILNK